MPQNSRAGSDLISLTAVLPVSYSTDVKLDVAEITPDPLLHIEQVDRLHVKNDLAQASLEGQSGIPAPVIG